ncbi:MAG: glycosyltransferase [Clostridium sp.]|nr:glycosyltransferase [Clostridium sp.]
MKIAHLTFGLTMGGIEALLVNLASEQVALGHDVHIFVVNDMVDKTLADRIDPRAVVHYMGRKPGSVNPIPYLRLNRLLSSISPDVIHLHFLKLSQFIFLPSLKKKLCATLHCMPVEEETHGLRGCGPIFSISDMVRKDLREKYGVDSTTVYNGVKLTEIKTRDDHPFMRPLRLIQVSRLEYIKGQDILIRAAALLKENRNVDLSLTFVGDGSQRDTLEKLAVDLGIGDNVTFTGTKSQTYVYEHLCDNDLFVLPSRFDGFALVVAEAMAARVPVLVCDDQAPYEVIEFGRYGRSFEGGSAEDCARAIMECAQSGYDAAAATEARQFACDNFDIKRTAARYIELYRTTVCR